MDVKTQRFQKASTEALTDDRLQAVMAGAIDHFDQARKVAVEEVTPRVWETYRERGRKIKEHTIENLDYYLELLTNRVEGNGGVVHFARHTDEATSIVLEIARARGVKRVVKSKSMLSEEMGLNRVLEAHGIESVETDLGEYIIQLSGETPFHIIAPAMHKSKEEVGELFSKKLHTKRLTEIKSMASAARQALRRKFLEADMGITGVNFAVAETGTIVLVTNEGNGRMCTSLPKVHVALMGMEKVVPALEDMAVMLRLLPRAATGQRITSYVTFVSGPRRRTDEDGPDEFHLVIIDNNRNKLLADPELREALNCIRCGACLNICPVYRKIGGHSYGYVYPGPIGAVVTPVMVGLPKAKDLPFASSLCGACKEVCPVKINIPRMLLKLRSDLVEGSRSQRKSSIFDRLLSRIWGITMFSSFTLAWAHRLIIILQKPLKHEGNLRRIPIPILSRWMRARDFPSLARYSFHQKWKKTLKDESKGKGSEGNEEDLNVIK